MRPFVLLMAVTLAACGGGSDDGSKAKLAGDLVTCKNDLSSLKEQLAEAKAALAKAMEAAGMVVKLDPIDIKAMAQGGPAVKHMEGNIPPDQVVKVVKLNAGGLKACYEKALKRKPDLQYVSAVTAKFQIKNTGNAINVHFAPHTDGEMESCMAGAMGKWKFPTFDGDPVAYEAPVNLVAK
jgi:hypothetical protein